VGAELGRSSAWPWPPSSAHRQPADRPSASSRIQD
jgi:hypothetical protein